MCTMKKVHLRNVDVNINNPARSALVCLIAVGDFCVTLCDCRRSGHQCVCECVCRGRFMCVKEEGETALTVLGQYKLSTIQAGGIICNTVALPLNPACVQ